MQKQHKYEALQELMEDRLPSPPSSRRLTLSRVHHPRRSLHPLRGYLHRDLNASITIIHNLRGIYLMIYICIYPYMNNTNIKAEIKAPRDKLRRSFVKMTQRMTKLPKQLICGSNQPQYAKYMTGHFVPDVEIHGLGSNHICIRSSYQNKPVHAHQG